MTYYYIIVSILNECFLIFLVCCRIIYVLLLLWYQVNQNGTYSQLAGAYLSVERGSLLVTPSYLLGIIKRIIFQIATGPK